MATAEVQQVVPAAVHDNNNNDREVHDMPSTKVAEEEGAPLAEDELPNNGGSKEQEIVTKEQEAITIVDTADDDGCHDIAHEVEAKLAVEAPPADAKEVEPEEEEEGGRRRVQAKKTTEKAASKASIVPFNDDDEPDEEVVAAPVAAEHEETVEEARAAAAGEEEEATKGEQQAVEDNEENACEKSKVHEE